ncbi:hypothetical protein ACFXKR_30715 [Streptomyces violascens]|uniref:hypothetical protein n=1 Tax=Streptomyces violascens TaxID=67381 RepID=UPI003688DF42
MSTAELKAASEPERDPAPDPGDDAGGEIDAAGPDSHPGGSATVDAASPDRCPGGSAEADAATPDAHPDGPAGSTPPTNRLRRALTLTLTCVLTLLLVGAGLLFQARKLTDTTATRNHALTDTSATTQVIGDVSNTLGKVFSYVPQDTRATEDAAKELLGGRAAGQYAALFGELRQRVADQKLSLTTHVVRAGVTRLTHDTAELLVFLDQRAQRDGKPATTAAAQLSITAQLADGHWQITDIRAR